MKKLFSMAAAVALALCLSVSVFASGSVKGVISGVSGAGIQTTPPEQTLSNADAVKVVNVSNVESVNVLAVFDLEGNPGDITFTLAFTPDANTRILHYENNAWKDVTKSFDATAKTVTATFETYSPVAIAQVTTTSSNGGTKYVGKINVTWSDGGVVVDQGQGNFLMVPNAGYAVKDVIVDGTSVGAVNNYTFANTDADHTMMVYFMATGAKTGASPKTGEHNFVALAAGLAAIAGLGAVAISHKKHA